MKTKQDLENYTQALLNTLEVDEKIIKEFSNVQLLLTVYKLGLSGENFPAELLFENFDLKKTPEEYHTLLSQMAVIKGESYDTPPHVIKYLLQTVNELLKRYKHYFNSPNL